MSLELTKKQVCLLLETGMQFWMDPERAEKLYEFIYPKDPNAPRPESIHLLEENSRFARRQIIGFFPPEKMEEFTRRKNGQWQCRNGTWHDRFTRCECVSREVRNVVLTLEEKIKNCGKCRDGYIDFRDTNGSWHSKKCQCIS